MSLPLKRALPVAVPAFVYRVGSVGLDLVPMLIVALAFPPEQAAVIMAMIRGAGVVGNLLGGWLTDVLGIKACLHLGFWLSAIGMAALPFQKIWWAVGLVAFLAAVGNEVIKSPNRMTILLTLPKSQHAQGIGWFRTANNVGYVLAFSISFLAAEAGFLVLMLFDSATSVFASLMSLKLLKDLPKTQRPQTPLQWKDFKLPRALFLVSLIGALYSLTYRMLMTGASARSRLVFGEDSIQVFSVFMMINALMCASLAMWAARRFESPGRAATAGISLTLVGIVLVSFTTNPWIFWLAAGISTLGEVIVMALMVVWAFSKTPEGTRQSLQMGVSQTLQHVGGMIGASTAFPILVYTQNAFTNALAVTMAVGLLLSLALRQVAKESTAR